MEEKYDEKKMLEIIKALGRFMKQTNQTLASLQLQIDNLNVDIGKLKKENSGLSLIS